MRWMAITFDDVPCLESYASLAQVRQMNKKILGCLRRWKVPATAFVNESKFFWRGEQRSRIAILQNWIDAGHEIGNHTASHKNLSAVGLEAFCRDVVAGEQTANGLLLAKNGTRMRFFRFPGLDEGQGELRQQVRKFLEHRGYTIAPITIDPRDWEFNARQRLFRENGRAAEAAEVRRQFLAHLAEELAKARNGKRQEILLLHLCTLTADCLDDILTLTRNAGFVHRPLAQVLLGTSAKNPVAGSMRKGGSRRFF